MLASQGLEHGQLLLVLHPFGGHREAKLCRQEMAEMMSQPEILKAQRAARDWMKLAN